MRPYQNDFSDSLNTAYTLGAYALALRDIASFVRNGTSFLQGTLVALASKPK
jgi:hypothetical protein